MPIIEATAAISVWKAATKTVRGIINLSKDVAVKERAAELLAVILSLQDAYSSLRSHYDEVSDAKREVEKKLKHYVDWSKTKSHYRLEEVSPHVFVYSPKQLNKVKEPIHWLCTNCWEDTQKSILTLKNEGTHTLTLICPRCKQLFFVKLEEPNDRLPHISRSYPPWKVRL